MNNSIEARSIYIPVKTGRPFSFRNNTRKLAEIMELSKVTALSFGCHARGYEGAALAHIRFWAMEDGLVVPLEGERIPIPIIKYLFSGDHPLAIEDPTEIIEVDSLCDYIMTKDYLAVSSMSSQNISFDIGEDYDWKDFEDIDFIEGTDLETIIDALDSVEHTLTIHPKEPMSAHDLMRNMASIKPSLEILSGILNTISGFSRRAPTGKIKLLWNEGIS